MIVYVVIPFMSDGIETIPDMIGVFRKREDAEHYVQSEQFKYYQIESVPLS